MQVIHHIGLRAGDQERLALELAGVSLPSGENSVGIVSFEISEDDPRWQRVHSACRQFSVIDTVTTKFTDGELHSAEFLGLVASGQFGFPEPSEDGGYLDATFDVSEYCRVCGIGAKQIAPFRVKKPPTRKNSLVQLNWIFDEYFVARDVWTSVFNPLGVKSRPVLLHKTGRVIDSIVQISIDTICDVAVDELPRARCIACGRIKYEYSLRGPYPVPVSPTAEIFRSSQLFGAGGRAFRLVIVSRNVFRKMRDARLRGLEFFPCAHYPSVNW